MDECKPLVPGGALFHTRVHRATRVAEVEPDTAPSLVAHSVPEQTRCVICHARSNEYWRTTSEQ